MTPAGIVLLCLFVIFAISLVYSTISSRKKSKSKDKADDQNKE